METNDDNISPHSPEVLSIPGSPSRLSCREFHVTPFVVTKETCYNDMNENSLSSFVLLKHSHGKAMVQPSKQPFNSEIKYVLEEELRGDTDAGVQILWNSQAGYETFVSLWQGEIKKRLQGE